MSQHADRRTRPSQKDALTSFEQDFDFNILLDDEINDQPDAPRGGEYDAARPAPPSGEQTPPPGANGTPKPKRKSNHGTKKPSLAKVHEFFVGTVGHSVELKKSNSQPVHGFVTCSQANDTKNMYAPAHDAVAIRYVYDALRKHFPEDMAVCMQWLSVQKDVKEYATEVPPNHTHTPWTTILQDVPAAGRADGLENCIVQCLATVSAAGLQVCECGDVFKLATGETMYPVINGEVILKRQETEYKATTDAAQKEKTLEETRKIVLALSNCFPYILDPSPYLIEVSGVNKAYDFQSAIKFTSDELDRSPYVPVDVRELNHGVAVDAGPAANERKKLTADTSKYIASNMKEEMKSVLNHSNKLSKFLNVPPEDHLAALFPNSVKLGVAHTRKLAVDVVRDTISSSLAAAVSRKIQGPPEPGSSLADVVENTLCELLDFGKFGKEFPTTHLANPNNPLNEYCGRLSHIKLKSESTKRKAKDSVSPSRTVPASPLPSLSPGEVPSTTMPSSPDLGGHPFPTDAPPHKRSRTSTSHSSRRSSHRSAEKSHSSSGSSKRNGLNIEAASYFQH